MINSVFKALAKVFGSKSERDLKEVLPFVQQINTEFEKLAGLSHDQLRGKTQEFRTRISDYLSDIDSEINTLKASTGQEGLDLNEKENIFTEIEKLRKQRDEELEKVLMEILPEAF